MCLFLTKENSVFAARAVLSLLLKENMISSRSPVDIKGTNRATLTCVKYRGARFSRASSVFSPKKKRCWKGPKRHGGKAYHGTSQLGSIFLKGRIFPSLAKISPLEVNNKVV